MMSGPAGSGFSGHTLGTGVGVGLAVAATTGVKTGGGFGEGVTVVMRRPISEGAFSSAQARKSRGKAKISAASHRQKTTDLSISDQFPAFLIV
jgi:ATP-dependent protease Clp ATPase subunit